MADLVEADAAKPHSGAMIALIPSEADAARLALDGGEPAEELHLTLAYLGKAADLDADARQDLIDAVTTAANGLQVVEANIFAAALFNPGGPEPCLVYLAGGAALDAAHTLIAAIPHIPAGQHAPWHAHITAVYSGDVDRMPELLKQVGPVRFDRLRIALGEQTIDIPLLDAAPIAEAYNPGQLRDPGGDNGGQWVADPSMSWAEVIDSYGPTHDEAESGDFTVAVFERGDFTLFYRGGPDRYEAVRELDDKYAGDLAGRLDQFANDAADTGPDPERGDELVDYLHIGDSDALVGRTGDGMVVFSASKSGDREPDLHILGSPAADQFHLTADDARGLADALRDMVERYDDLNEAARLTEGSPRPRRGPVAQGRRRVLTERYDPAQHRAADGKWSRMLAAADLQVGDAKLRLTHHGDGRVSVHDEHGGSLHLDRVDLQGGRTSGKARAFAYRASNLENVGDRDWLDRIETRGGKPWTTALAGIHTTHVADATGDDDEPYLRDRHTLHLAAGGKGVDDHTELFDRPGTELTTAQLQGLADTLRAFADGHEDVDTGHGRVVMGVTGRAFTFDTGKRADRPIVLNRGELRNVDKALNAAFDAFDPDGNAPLPAGEKFQRTIATKAVGDIVVTRTGADADFWVESDTTAIRIKPDALHDVLHHIDAMLALSGDLKHLTPVAVRPVIEAAAAAPGPRPVVLAESGRFQAL